MALEQHDGVRLLEGGIQFLSGSILFPYKPLYITKGSLYFPTPGGGDSLISLIATNKIKKYRVTLHVTGTVADHTVTLSSVPHLAQEQIISLLLSGSEAESLATAVPAIVMQNIQNSLFSSGVIKAPESSSLGRLLSSLRRVQVVPNFTDQTGRGGLWGIIEIDVNERWRALLQKNLSLSEDVRFEVEYLLSDDISIKALRDERGDMSGEVEMRIKF